MGIEDGKTPGDTGRHKQAPSSHAVRSVNARIQAGPLWREIVRSDTLPEPLEVETPWRRVATWRRSVPNSRLIAVGVLATAAITAVSLASSPYRWPTLPEPGGVGAIVNIVNPPGQGDDSSDTPSSSPASSSSSGAVSAPKPHEASDPSAPKSSSAGTVAAPVPSTFLIGLNTTPTPTPSSAPTTVASSSTTTPAAPSSTPSSAPDTSSAPSSSDSGVTAPTNSVQTGATGP